MQERERSLAGEATGLWWVFLLTGLLWLLVSVVVLRFTTTSVTTVGVLIGIVFVGAAANEMIVSGLARGWRWLHVVLALLFLAGAIWSFVHPDDAFWALASVLGFLLIFKGTLDVVEAAMSREVNPLWGLGLAAGIAELLLGFWASQQYYPARAALILIWVGFFALFRGVGEIVLAFRLRSAHREVVGA